MLQRQTVEQEVAVAKGAQRSQAPGWALASLALSMLLSSLGTSIANVGLPALVEALHAPFQQVQWVVLAYLMVITVTIVSAGRLGDLIGRKRLLLAGIALFTLASALCGMAPGLGALIAARAVQGLGAAVMMALTMAMVGETVSKEKTGSAMGLLGTMSAVGTALGPSLGGVLIAGLGWRAIFLVSVPLGVLGVWLAYRFLPEEARKPGGKIAFDPLGTSLLALMLAAYALAMTLGRGQFGLLNIGLLAAALAGAALFVYTEQRVSAPLIRLSMLRDRAFSASLIASAVVSTVMMATLVVGPFYLSRGLGLAAALVGLTLSAGPVVTALIGVPAGRLVDRHGARRIMLGGLGTMIAGAVILMLLPLAGGVAGYVAAITILTIGYALFQAANNTAVMANVAAERRGLVSGMLNLARNLGLITGASLMGAVFAQASGAGEIASASVEAVARGMHVTFAVAAGLVAVALAVILGSGGAMIRQADTASAQK